MGQLGTIFRTFRKKCPKYPKYADFDHFHTFVRLSAPLEGPGVFSRVKTFWIPLPNGLRKPKSHQTANVGKMTFHPLFAQSAVAGAAVTPGHAAEVAYHRKMVATADDCEREGIKFFPLAAESLGGWHPVAVQQVDMLAAALARHSGVD